ncbi:unnamed protein product [Lota lota]
MGCDPSGLNLQNNNSSGEVPMDNGGFHLRKPPSGDGVLYRGTLCLFQLLFSPHPNPTGRSGWDLAEAQEVQRLVRQPEG